MADVSFFGGALFGGGFFAPALAPAPAKSQAGGGQPRRRARRAPSFIGVSDVRPAIKASASIVLEGVNLFASASLAEAPSVTRRRLAIAALLN